MKRCLLLLLIPFFLAVAALAQNPAQLETVAEVNGERISSQDLLQVAGEPLSRLEQQVYQLKQQKLQEMIADRLLAEEAHRRKVTLESLIEAEITSKVAPITPEEIHSVYELNKNQLQRPESEVSEQIKTLLRDQKVAQLRRDYAKSLQVKAKVSIHLTAPPPFRAEVTAEGPSRGPADAPVTIVEFEDFQCPFCRKAQSTVDEVVSRYGNKVRIVHRDFPLEPLHPASMKAHEASRCAAEQGKFWQYRDLLYKNAPAAASDQLNDYASRTGLNITSFKQCVESDKYKMAVQNDESEGERLGVQGTPAFFINGRLLSGAQPENEFVRIIDEELNRRAQR